jgi:hypothetical protein
MVFGGVNSEGNRIITGKYNEGLDILEPTANHYPLNVNVFALISTTTILDDVYCLNAKAVFNFNKHYTIERTGKEFEVAESSLVWHNQMPKMWTEYNHATSLNKAGVLAAGLLGCWIAGLLGCWVAGLLGC